LVRKAISDVTEEVAAFGFGLEELLVLNGGEGEVAIKFTAVEAEIKNPARCNVCCGSQELGFDWLPVQTLCVIRDCAHDSKIVGTISLRWWKCHAACAAVAGNRFHGSSSAIRLIG
jgi:hypothetical protein